MKNNVDLGFIEESPGWKLQSRFFPSKVGGKPAWLDLQNIPEKTELKCSKCTKPSVLLCQIYAPIDNIDECFHRTIYIFMCKNETCFIPNVASNFKVLRNQIPRKNIIYSFDPPEEHESWRTDICAEKFNVHLCEVCGTKSTSCCGKCKKVYYCSKDHQKIDWKHHKVICCGENTCDEKFANKNGLLLPEYEIIIDTEDHDVKSSGDEEKEQLEQMECYNKFVLDGKAGIFNANSSVDDDLMKMAFSEEDKIFSEFKSRISTHPDQVLRYEKDGVPLWISKDGIPKKGDIPSCSYCGGERTFEFQILPQLLNYLGLEENSVHIDWGTLAVYTCKQSCNFGPHYREEFLWKQDIVLTTENY